VNRRSFFGMVVGGVAAASAVRIWPFRVFSFPAQIVKPVTSMRFIRMFDPVQMRMINRFDVLYGWGRTLECPNAVEAAQVMNVTDGVDSFSAHEIESFKKLCIEKCIPPLQHRRCGPEKLVLDVKIKTEMFTEMKGYTLLSLDPQVHRAWELGV
jgi:hypothetical protein